MQRSPLICAVTDDAAARDVVDTGRELAAATGSPLIYASIAEVDIGASATIVPAGAGLGWAPFPEGAFHTAEQRAVERAAGFLRELGVGEGKGEVRVGSPAVELCELARRSGAAAIVLGGPPPSPLRALAMGSTARWLVTNGDVPVVFGRPREALDLFGPVVCGIDPHAPSAAAVAAVAARFASLLDRALVLLHVGWFGPSEERDVLGYETRLGNDHRAAERALDALAATLPDDLSVEVALDDGEEADRLIAQADGRRASLLVTGNRGRGPLRTTLAGSISLELASSARQPVVVVPPALTPEQARRP